MAVASDTTHVACPKCSTQLEPAQSDADRVTCFSCGWKGTVLLFRPVSTQVEQAETALPDDATCVHHPAKRAVEVCAGTGDYICSLCSIEIDGRTYSAQHIDTVGADKIGKAFNRYLARPDNEVVLYMLLCFLPLANLGTPIWVFLGIKKLSECSRERKREPLLGRLVSGARLVVLSVIFGLAACIGVLFCVSFVAALAIG